MEISTKTIERLTEIITGNSKRSPYRTGPQLVEFFRDFGEQDTYGAGFPSRASYVQEKLRKFNGTATLGQVVAAAFDFFDERGFNPEEEARLFRHVLARDGYMLVKHHRQWMHGETTTCFEVQPAVPVATMPGSSGTNDTEAAGQMAKVNRETAGDVRRAAASRHFHQSRK